jgi:hypothetical protein
MQLTSGLFPTESGTDAATKNDGVIPSIIIAIPTFRSEWPPVPTILLRTVGPASIVTLVTFVILTVDTLAGRQVHEEWLEKNGNALTAIVLFAIDMPVFSHGYIGPRVKGNRSCRHPG